MTRGHENRLTELHRWELETDRKEYVNYEDRDKQADKMQNIYVECMHSTCGEYKNWVMGRKINHERDIRGTCICN